MNKVHVLIWGENGTIGSAIKKSIMFNSRYTLAIDPKNYGYRFGKEFTFQKIKGKKPSVVIIACGPRDHDIEELEINSYIENINNFIDSLPANIHLIYVSTARVYEGYSEVNINEVMEVHPLTQYSLLHLMIEQKCLSNTFKCTILRPQAVYNYEIFDSRRPELIVNSFPSTLIEGRDIVLKSEGTALRNFVAASDIGNCITIAISQEIYGIIHPIGFRTLSIKNYKELVEIIYKVVFLKMKVNNFPYFINDKFPSISGYHSIRLSQNGRDILTDTINLFRKF